jgi:hypothetical protein
MIFKYNKRRIIEETITRSITIILLCYLGYHFNLIKNEPKVNYTLPILWVIAISLHIYKVLKTITNRWEKPAISTSDKTIEFPVFNLSAPWNNIQNLTYEVGLRDSFLVLNLNNKIVKTSNNKLLNYYYLFKVWFNSGPIKINLDELEGEPKENFNLILEYKQSMNAV